MLKVAFAKVLLALGAGGAVAVRYGKKSNAMQSKKSFALINYEICSPKRCNPDEGVCAAVSACSHKVIKQIDGVFEQPMIFQDMCMGCWDCIEVCSLDAITIKHIM